MNSVVSVASIASASTVATPSIAMPHNDGASFPILAERFSDVMRKFIALREENRAEDAAAAAPPMRLASAGELAGCDIQFLDQPRVFF